MIIMIITISGQAGSGKSTVAKLVAKKLNFRHHSMGDLRRTMAEKLGLTLYELNKLGEKEDFTDKETDAYQKKLGEEEDNFVIDGRLSFKFIPHSKKIFLTADSKTRAERVFKDERKKEKFHSLEEAEKRLGEREKSDSKRYKKYYGIDHLEKKQYDLVIDASKITAEQVADKIVEFVKK